MGPLIEVLHSVFYGIDISCYRKARANTGLLRAIYNRMEMSTTLRETDAKICEAGERQRKIDLRWMHRALELARFAEEQDDEVPVGAVLVLGEHAVGEGWNRCITLNDPTAHAEILALRAAGVRLANYRFPGSALYVTLEPCAMCAMAMVHARVERVVFAAYDPKTGAAGSVFDTLISDRHNHRIALEAGLLEDQSTELLRHFFSHRRNKG